MSDPGGRPDLYGLLLAGGFSRRMQQDKALLHYHDRPQVQVTHELLCRLCRKVFLSLRPDQTHRPEFTSFSILPDDPTLNVRGPLAGILSALRAHPDKGWLVLACDLPFLSGSCLAYLMNRRRPDECVTAFASRHDGLPEPLAAIYEPAARPVLEAALARGIHCPRKILMEQKPQLLTLPEPRALDNVNTPEEFREAREFIAPQAQKPAGEN